MSAWNGLHNPERHEPSNDLATCLIEHANPVMARWCTPSHPCRCCMDQEARNLRAENEALREALDDAERIVGVLEAQVQRVRDVIERRAWWALQDATSGLRTRVVYVDHALRALDGGDEVNPNN